MISKVSNSYPRIFLLEPNWGNKTYPYYFGTIKEVIALGLEVKIVKEQITSIKDIQEVGLTKNDLIIFGYGWLGSEFFYRIEGLEDLINKKIVFFHKPFNNYKKKVDFVKQSKFDLLLSSTPKTSLIENDTNIKTILFPYGFDDRVFGLSPQKYKKFDIGFSGALHNSCHYKGVEFSSQDLRYRAQQKISKYFLGRKFMNGSDNIWNRIRSTKSYAKRLQQSKLWLSTTGPMNDMSSRYFEVLGSSSICITNPIPKEYSKIFINNENVIVFKDDCSNLLDKIAETLEDQKKLNQMSVFAKNEILKNHTYKKRALDLLKYIDQLLDS